MNNLNQIECADLIDRDWKMHGLDPYPPAVVISNIFIQMLRGKTMAAATNFVVGDKMDNVIARALCSCEPCSIVPIFKK